MLAYIGGGDAERSLYLRSLDRLDAMQIDGVRDATHLAFSPDGHAIAFGQRGAIDVISVDDPSKQRRRIATTDSGSFAWLPDESFVVGAYEIGLVRISPDAETVESLVAQPAPDRPLLWPDVLPGGRAVLYAVHASADTANASRVEVFDFETRTSTLVLEAAGNPVYAESGHLLFARGSTLMAAPFDAASLKITGPAVSVVESVRMAGPSGSMNFAISKEGTLVYTREQDAVPKSVLTRINPSGESRALTGGYRSFNGPQLSPDGRTVAVSIAGGGGSDVWMHDLARGGLTRLTFDRYASEIVWHPDGIRIAFAALGNGLAYNVFSKSVDEAVAPVALLRDVGVMWPGSFTPDGKTLIVTMLDTQTGRDIRYFQLDATETMPFLVTKFHEDSPRLSPEGDWLAYVSDESGRREVYLQRFPQGGAKQQVSVSGGAEPVWARDGRALFFREGTAMMSVSLADGNSAEDQRLGMPEALFEGPYLHSWSNAFTPNYDVSPDGHFVVLAPDPTHPQEIVVVLNWFSELKRLVPSEQ